MRTQLTLALVAALSALSAQDAPRPGVLEEVPQPQPQPQTRAVDLAICLDTSGSMSGLIESAKQKLWAIVNDLALAEPEPLLRVALLTYGNDGHPAEDGWVRVDIPLTTDLDIISQRLFALGTNGGTELVGRVISRATTALEWSGDPMALKLIVVAGNESADQDQQVPFRVACKAAITSGVMINSIYCGNPADTIAPGWAEVARLADGHFASIDHNDGMVVVETPFDNQLAMLSLSVNDTYVALGDAGVDGLANQVAQDRNAESLNSAAAASRASTKGGRLWRKSWDLVDRCQEKDFDWGSLEDEDLPEEMRKLDLAGRKAYITGKQAERTRIHTEIGTLTAKRDSWVGNYKRLKGIDETKSFDHALLESLREQARSKGFEFKKPEVKIELSPEEVKAMEEAMRKLEAELEAAKKKAEQAVEPPKVETGTVKTPRQSVGGGC